MKRRRFIVGSVGLAAFGSPSALASHARRTNQPKPSARATETALRLFDLPGPDELGVQLPNGYRARRLARSGDLVAGSALRWHLAPDGGGVVPTADGGWIYVSNSEVGNGGGGASAIEFGPDGEVRAARRILSATSRNCAGGMTPWGTWLSCEENRDDGLVWECDPTGATTAIARTAIGRRNHEAAAVAPDGRTAYLTEDAVDGRLWRFTADAAGDLSSGRLAALRVHADTDAMHAGATASADWVEVALGDDDRPAMSVADSTAFRGGEGAWLEGGSLLFTTKYDRRLWELDATSSELRLLVDAGRTPDSPIQQLDNVTVHPTTGDVFACEDVGNMEIFRLRRDGDTLTIEVFMRIQGHPGSETTGVAFSPDGQHMYCSSQRGSDGSGETFEVTGPFDR